MSDSSQSVKAKEAEAPSSQGGGQEVTLDEALELGKSHHQAGNYTIADRTYRDILKAVPDHFPTTHFLGLLCYQRGQNEEALKYSKKAVKAEPDNSAVWINHGAVLMANERYDDAVEAFDEAIAIEPEVYGAWTNKSYALWLQGRYEEAEEAALQATMIDDTQVEAYINMGIALAEQGKLDEANDVWVQAADIAPEESKVYANWSNTLRSAGALEKAREKGEKAVALDEKNAEALCNLANALRDLGQISEALEIYKKATDIQPDFYRAHGNMAIALTDLERYPEAITAARYAISFKKDYGMAYSTLSIAHHGMGQAEEAYAAADQAVSIEPDKAIHYIHMAEALLALRNYDEAEAVIDKALSLDPGDPRTLIALAEIKRGLDEIDDAIEALDKAIMNHAATPLLLLKKAQILNFASRPDDALKVIDQALENSPNNPHVLFGKADILLSINRKDEAGEIIEKAGKIASSADMPAYYMNLISYKKLTKEDEEFKAFEKMVNDNKYGLDTQSGMHFAMFRLLERLGDYDAAFEHLKKGNDLQIQMHKTDTELRPHFSREMKNNFPPEGLAQYEGLGCDSDVPVFVLGMPRSGTTLTEQTISSHHQVFPGGELYDVMNVIRALGPLTPEKAAIIGEEYVRRIQKRDTTGKALRITDKMPGNYQNIGLIKCILPHAKIIHCRRNPMDNLLSCYKQNFAQGHEWSNHMELAAYQYIEYNNVMNYWREVLPEGSFLEINYEDTVNDFENQARKLIDFIGLEWDEACLEPHKQQRPVLTASKEQVIRPVYKTSVESWRRYEKQLAPMYKILEDAGLVKS